MRREHASEVTRVNIFTHNGAPQALVGCLETSDDPRGGSSSGLSDATAHPTSCRDQRIRGRIR
jgi:hypothetical protein